MQKAIETRKQAASAATRRESGRDAAETTKFLFAMPVIDYRSISQVNVQSEAEGKN